jgi:hypothetical protein
MQPEKHRLEMAATMSQKSAGVADSRHLQNGKMQPEKYLWKR